MAPGSGSVNVKGRLKGLLGGGVSKAKEVDMRNRKIGETKVGSVGEFQQQSP